MSYFSSVGIKDGANLDAFSRLRVSNPTYLFDSMQVYDGSPLLFESITNGSGATVAFDSTNKQSVMTFSSTPTGGKAFMQSYEWIPYQPGRSQLALITFCMNGGVANVLKFAGLGDGTNGMQLELNGTTLQFTIYSGTRAADTVVQSQWNVDKFDGTGPSGVTLDMSKSQILVIDYQALLVGRVRFGFDVNGVVYYAHAYTGHANTITVPYIANPSLPIRCGMTCTGTVSTTMAFVCSSVMSEGGNLGQYGYTFSQEGSGTAGSGTAVHILSIRPKTTFNSITNRSKFILNDVETVVTGANAVRFDIVVGQAISGTTTFADVNATYSAYQYNTAGTISGSPAIVIGSFYTSATRSAGGQAFTNKYPIALDAAGAVRSLGTISILATGQGGTSACAVSMNWTEVR